MNHEFGSGLLEQPHQCVGRFPDVRGTINGSLGAEFEKFQRTLVDEFLSWLGRIS
ncbi:MAG: hypothetical protein ACLVG6_02465 [Dorea formicigenerans]